MKAALTDPGKRLAILLALAAAAGALAFCAPSEESAPVAAAPARGGKSSATPSSRALAGRPASGKADEPAALALDRFERTAAAESKDDLFASARWNAPPPAPLPGPASAASAGVLPGPPPKPRPPPLPFQFFGHMVDGEAQSVFLTHGQRNLVVKAGEVIDGAWRVESIDARRIVFRYLPLDETLDLARGEQ